MNTKNPVIELCEEGMKAESEGRVGDAYKCFTQAWELRQNDYDACIAAHYLARHQKNGKDSLHWNLTSLKFADAVNDSRVKSFYPSLYINIGHSYKALGNIEKTKYYYDLAARHTSDLPKDGYGDILRTAILEAQKEIIEI